MRAKPDRIATRVQAVYEGEAVKAKRRGDGNEIDELFAEVEVKKRKKA